LDANGSFLIRLKMCEHPEKDTLGSDNTEFRKETFMAVLILAVVLTIITGAQYFGRPLTRTVWLVLFILSALALLLVLVAYRSIGI
jgi:uncharacterized protein (DUF983 family)